MTARCSHPGVARGLRLAVAAWLLAVGSGHAQQVRRATAVGPGDQPDGGGSAIPRAIPLEPFVTSTPAPRVRPAPRAAPVQHLPVPVLTEEPPAATPPSRAQKTADQVQLDFANSFYARGDIESAAPEYERYLSTYPGAPVLDRESALFRLGECYRRIGNVNAARNSYETLILNFAIGQFIGPAAYRLADMAYAGKDYDAALNYYRKASVRLADPSVALAAKFYSARCLDALKLPSEARVTYEDVIATRGENPYRDPSRLALAGILADYGRKNDAVDQLEALARESTTPAVKVEALVKSGLLYVDLGQPAKGEAQLDKALAIPEIGDWRPVAQMGLLRVLYESGKYKELLAKSDEAIATLPPDIKPEVIILAANSRRQLGDFAGASELYQQILKDYPASQYGDEAGYQNLVSMYNSNNPGLIPAIDRYLAGKTEIIKRDQVTLLKAEALFKAQRYEEAAPVYASLQDSTLSSSFRAESLFKLGWCYMQIHQQEKAIAALTTFLKGYPLNKLAASALAQRAVAYQQTKDLASALKDFDRLLQNYPKARERELALQQKALILGEQQDNSGMADAFRQLLDEFPKSPAAAQANYWIGFAAFNAKDYKNCIAPLERARKLDATQFFERASVRIVAACYTLEDRDKLAHEVDLYNGGNPKDKVHPDVLRWLGNAYLQAHDGANAQKYLAQLVTCDDAAQEDWYNLASANLASKQYDEAIKNAGKYLDGQNDPALQAKGLLLLGRAQLESGRLEDAQASADKACTAQPEGLPNAKGRMLSGDIRAQRGDYEAAAKIYQTIAVLIDDAQVTPQALEQAYQCLTRVGRTVDAAKVLNELQTRYPEYQVKTGGISTPF